MGVLYAIISNTIRRVDVKTIHVERTRSSRLLVSSQFRPVQVKRGLPLQVHPVGPWWFPPSEAILVTHTRRGLIGAEEASADVLIFRREARKRCNLKRYKK